AESPGRAGREKDGNGHRGRAGGYARPRRDGPDTRVCSLPRPQVRPGQHGGLLRAGGRLPEHTDDGAVPEGGPLARTFARLAGRTRAEDGPRPPDWRIESQDQGAGREGERRQVGQIEGAVRGREAACEV